MKRVLVRTSAMTTPINTFVNRTGSIFESLEMSWQELGERESKERKGGNTRACLCELECTPAGESSFCSYGRCGAGGTPS